MPKDGTAKPHAAASAAMLANKKNATPAEETPHPMDQHAPAVTGRAEHEAEPVAARAS